MRQLWRIPDFLDLEYFFARDRTLVEQEGEETLRQRDRTLYLEEMVPEIGDGEPEREELLHRWLQLRRSQESAEQGNGALLPGRMWYELYGLFWALCSFLALASGGGLSYSFLSYAGERPVNVALFFLFFVGSQLLILLLLLLGWGYRKAWRLDLRASLLLSLVNRGLTVLLFKVGRYGLDRLGAERRAEFAASFGALRARGKGYGALFFWPLFLLFQLFGISFNFGVLGGMLLKVATTDVAFGWQSTLQLSTRLVNALVQGLALPWSWLLPAPGGSPTLAQIEGSRIVLKEGIYQLASSDLASWWPFLCLAVLCYGLLPRLLLFILGIGGRKRAMARVSFQRAEHNQLMHRLLTPRLESGHAVQEPAPVVEQAMPKESTPVKEEPLPRPEPQSAAQEPSAPVNGELSVLIPDELIEELDPAELERLCRARFGYGIGERIEISQPLGDTAPLLKRLAGENCPPLLILQEAWQPPIREMIVFLEALRGNCGPETHIILALIGRPRPDTFLTPVSPMDRTIWQQKVAPLADPSLQVAPLVEAT